MRLISIILLSSLSLLLAGCLTDYKLYRINHTTAYSVHNFSYYNQNNDLRTIIYGNPTKASKAELEVAITNAMQGRNAFGKTNFTTTPNDSDDLRTKFVIQFNPDISKTAHDLCIKEMPPPFEKQRADKITMIMAYCMNNRYLAYIFGETAQPATPNDPAFLEMIGDAVQNLIPIYDPNRGSECRNSLNC